VTYDLTIDGLHTYYVLAGKTPILVHNIDVPCTTTTIHRVQTDHPLSQRLSVDDAGDVQISGNGMLHLNMSGDISHSQTYRGGQGQIVTFDVPTDFVDEVRNLAVPQRRPPGMTRQEHRGRPQIDDPTMGPDLFGIPGNMLSDLQSAIIPGSGRIVGG
jgi:hypothetical protein